MAAASSVALPGASLGLVQALGTGHVTGTVTVQMVVSAAMELALSTGTTGVGRGVLDSALMMMTTNLTTSLMWSIRNA